MEYSLRLKKVLIFIELICLALFCASCASVEWPNLADPLPAVSDRQSARFSVHPIDLAVSPPPKVFLEDQNQINIEDLLSAIKEQLNLLEANLQKSRQNRPVGHHWLKEQMLLTRFDQLRDALRRFITHNQSRRTKTIETIETHDAQIAASQFNSIYHQAKQLSLYLHAWLGPEPPEQNQSR